MLSPLRRSSSIRPARGQPQQEVLLPGNLEAYTDSPIYARTDGYLKKWYFDIGAHVRKGQLLADIESPEVDQQLAQAQADLATAETNAANARVQSTRYQELVKTDSVSQLDTDNFKTQAAAGDTAVKSARANVQRLSELVGFEKVYAPFDGVITARNIDIGQLIDEGAGNGTGATELFHMAAAQTLRAYVNVPQIYTPGLKPGLTADLTFREFPGKTFTGKLVRTSRQIDPVSRTLLVEFDVDNRSGELFPGAYTEVHFKTNESAPSYIVPVSTLMFRSEGLRIAVVDQNNKARLVPVIIGHDDGATVQIVSGLNCECPRHPEPARFPDRWRGRADRQANQPSRGSRKMTLAHKRATNIPGGASTLVASARCVSAPCRLHRRPELQTSRCTRSARL